MQGEPFIFWAGIALGAFGVLGSILKAAVVWDSCHTIHDGGVPTFDFPIACPIPIAGSAWLLLAYYGAYPFAGFALLVYLAVAAAFGLLFVAFDRHGRPARDGQLADPKK